MKKLLLILAFALILNSCGNNISEESEQPDNLIIDDRLSRLAPVIDGYHGELFGDGDNITADGYYTGFEKLDNFGSMIYCNDDGAVIWSDRNGTVFRLSSQVKREKVCPYEDCRSDFESKCGHVILAASVYSNGYLYFADAYFDAAVYRYNFENYEIEKLIEFKGVLFCNLALNGRYLYVQTYNWQPHESDVIRPDNRVDFTIARIDLYGETAVILYSEFSNPDDLDNKIGELKDWRFVGTKIIMPKIDEEKIWVDNDEGWRILREGSSINISTLDMRNFETPLELETEKILFDFGGDLKLYDGELYFATGETGLNRLNPETGRREVLHENIRQFDIDGDFLYYIIGYDSALYRVRLDYTREINFNTAVEVYADYNIFNWRVYDGYLYADLMEAVEIAEGFQGNNNMGRYRIRLNSQDEPYLFYKY